MKNYYKISEISKLYGIGVDSLRYYERLGILTPKRDTNGYRLYNLTDLYKLNIIRDLCNLTIGAFLSMPSIKQNIANVYDSVFFVLDGEKKDYDFILPKGNYLTYFYRGSYEQNAFRVNEMIEYIKNNRLMSSEEPFELFTIDNRDTMKTEEFLTEIQIYLGGN